MFVFIVNRLLDSGCVLPTLLCCLKVLKSTCQMVQLVPFYRTAVLAYQLVLKVAEIHEALAKKVQVGFMYLLFHRRVGLVL